jgi:hypothetical protein
MRLSRSSGEAKTVPRVAADIAQRLLEAGRADEAWSAINAVDEKRPSWIPFEWEQVRLEVMEALDAMLRHKRSVGNVLSERSASPICALTSNGFLNSKI